MSDTDVSISGNVTRDVDLKYLPNGQAVVNFSVAVSHRYKVDDDWKERTSYFDVDCFAALAEHVAGSVNKGDRVLITGRLGEQKWKDKTTGNDRSKVAITADDVALSLKYATATAKRAVRETGGERQQVRAEQSAVTSRYEDEEPF